MFPSLLQVVTVGCRLKAWRAWSVALYWVAAACCAAAFAIRWARMIWPAICWPWAYN